MWDHELSIAIVVAKSLSKNFSKIMSRFFWKAEKYDYRYKSEFLKCIDKNTTRKILGNDFAVEFF